MGVTATEHDRREVKTLLTKTVLPIVMVSVMHLKWEFIRPLVMQTVMGPMAMAGSKLFQVYILGKETTGDLARPWKADANPLEQMLTGANSADAETEEKEEVQTPTGQRSQRLSKKDR